tara:strand:+ start:1225 stop:1563 length:339 start_codon:yes stop_codon:yes gene_type:complete
MSYKFTVDIWFAPEDADAYKESGMLGCPDEEHRFDSLGEAWEFYTTPRNVFHTQLTHYPNYKLDEWGDGNVLAEGTDDNYTYINSLTFEPESLEEYMDDGLEFGEWVSEGEE